MVLRLSSEDAALIDELAVLSITMGMTPIEARLQALLTISPNPLSLDDIAELLKVSKSSASVATRELERHGAAHRFSQRGSKRVRYGISDRNAGFLAAQVEFLGSVSAVLRKRADAVPEHETTPRLRGMADFYGRVRNALETALKGE